MRNLQRKVTLALIGLLWSITAIAQYSGDLLKEANSLFDSRSYADAMPLYAQLLSLDPTNPELNFKYGATALFGEANKKDDAIKYLKFASSKPGISPEVWYFLGKAYHLNYQFSDAISAYQTYQSLNPKGAADLRLEQDLSACRNGLLLLTEIKDIQVIDKKQSALDAFFRFYDLSEIGGKILVTPEELLTPLDKKNNHRSLVHFRGPGSDVYFSSYGKDGKNGLDIYRSQVLPDGSFSSPQLLGAGINSPFDEDYPFLHPDNKTFYFSSKGHTSMGGYDVFQSKFDAQQGVFSKPENLDFAVNTPDDELFYIADSTKNRANFASARSSRQGQVHVYQVKVQGIPLELTMIKGAFKNKIDPSIKLAKITVIDAATNKEIDSQYTDPKTGDYVLSFPRSGRYKFLVEVDKGQTVHAGSVVVPKGQGLNAYLQEMELIESAGIEKLVINNLFDQHYDGDIMAMAQKILRQRAELDINYDGTQEEVTPLPVNSEIDLAYHSAGFSIGLSNEQILDHAEQRVVNIDKEKTHVIDLQIAANQATASEFAAAENLTTQAVNELAKAQTGISTDRPEAMFKAAIAKRNAELAIQRAANAEILAENLQNLESDLETKEDAALKHQSGLAKALEEKNYTEALLALKAEKEWQVEENATGNTSRSTDAIQTQATESKLKSDAALVKASDTRLELDALQRELTIKRRLRELAKGKEAKTLEADIARLEIEEKDMTVLVNQRYASAELLQHEANDAQERLDLFRELESQQTSTPNSTATELIKPDFAKASYALDQLNIDNAAVAEYLINNQAALASMSAVADRAYFEKLYLSDGESNLAVADNQVIPSDQTNLTQTDTPIAESADEATPVDSSIAGNAVQSEVKLVGGVAAKNADVNTESQTAVSAEQNTAQHEDVSASEEMAISSVNDSQDTKSIDAENLAPVVLANEETASISPSTVQSDEVVQNRIDAEKVKINAANDWIAIIDESISELERGVGGSDELNPDDLKDQLDQYNKLRSDKLAEKTASEALINDLKLSRTSTKEQEAYTRAVQDVETLDAGTFASLESKIDGLSEDMSAVKLTSSVDRNYLPKLVSIELSGLSSPELAEKRISLNKSFIADLDILIRGEAASDFSEKELLELRRIKTIEILQDERIESGELAYSARTPEAREYTELITDSPNPLALVAPSNAGLSPEMASALAVPYSPDLLVPNYDATLQKINSKGTDIEQAGQRIDLNESYLSALQSDIQLYALAIEKMNPVDQAVLNRYNLLLRERSKIIDEIHADEANKASITSHPVVSAGENPALSSFIAESDESVLGVLEKQQAALEVLESKSLSQIETNRIKAGIFEESASTIEAEIVNLVSYMDQRIAESEREAIQLQIQKLDALANDQLVQAKLYTDESLILSTDEPESTNQELTLAATTMPNVEREDSSLPAVNATSQPDQIERPSSQNSTAATVNSNVEPNFTIEIPEASIDPIVLKGVNYKSLNANVANEVLISTLDSMTTMRNQIDALAKEYAQADNATEQALIISEAKRLQMKLADMDQSLVQNLARSNAAEIEYYISANDRLMQSIQSNSTTEAAEVNDLATQVNKIRFDLSQNDYRASRSDVTEANRVEEELILIARLEELNKRLVSEAGATATAEALTALEERPVVSNELAQGHVYLTESQEIVLQNLSEVNRASYVTKFKELRIDTTFVKSSAKSTQETLIGKITPIDAKGFKLLQSQPVHYQYVLASVYADSLKSLEQYQAQLAKVLSTQAVEHQGEIARLGNVAASEPISKNKEALLTRIASMEIEMNDGFNRSAIAAEQAEALRSSRLAQEAIVAQRASQLSGAELAELNGLLETPAYTVISTDLASTSPIQNTSRIDKKPSEIKVSSAILDAGTIDLDKGSPVNTVEPRPLVKTSSMASNARPSGLSADEEKLLNETGNWLALVEIIGEKDDFSDVSESLFIETEQSAYNANTPIPIDVVMPKGLVFQVQIGAFRNPIPQDLYGDIAPITGEKLPNGITRYRAGIFKLYKDAVSAKELVRSKGYSDAFVVAFVDGEQLTGAEAQEILNQASKILREEKATKDEADVQSGSVTNTDNATNPASVEGGLEKPELSTNYYDDPQAAEAEMVETTTGLFFTVQVGVYSKPVKLDALYNLTELNSEYTANKLIRYTSGRYESVNAAIGRKTEVISKGVADAFVTAYYNGRRISIDEANRVLAAEGNEVLNVSTTSSKQEKQQDIPVGGKNYVVVLGTFAGDIPQDVANTFLDRADLQVSRVKDSNSGTTTYYSQAFDSQIEAEAFLLEIQKAGLDELSVGILIDGKLSKVE